MAKSKISVAKYLEQQLAVCGKSQREISAEIGYANPNIMTMFKTGATKIPLTKVGALAKAIGADPAFMLRLVMGEYMPETWDAIEEIIGKDNLLTEQDKNIAALVRDTAGATPVDISIEENRKALSEAIQGIVARDQAKADAAVKRIDSLPKNARNR
jgi:hypothetical protein